MISSEKPLRPYTQNSKRLPDVIAAIQTMGAYKFYKLSIEKWSERIDGSSGKPEHWEAVFRQHPEFFRLDSSATRASLVLRRSYPKRYNVDTGTLVSHETFLGLSEQEKKRISRTPLSNADISTLIDIALKLSSSELENRKDSRWWISGTIGLAGVIIGALINSLIGS